MVKKIIKFILIILWMGVIFLFSSDSATVSSRKSNDVITFVYNLFNDKTLSNDEEEKLVQSIMYPVRKLAHFSEYFILGILIISFISEFTVINLKSCLIAILLCFIYACSDEIHQLFSIGRSAQIFDVMIDTAGSCFGIGIYKLIKTKIGRRSV